jgi:hypothetical protein
MSSAEDVAVGSDAELDSAGEDVSEGAAVDDDDAEEAEEDDVAGAGASLCWFACWDFLMAPTMEKIIRPTTTAMVTPMIIRIWECE